MRQPAVRLSVATLILIGGLGPGFADDVHLTNGKVYKDVLAERTPEGVRIDLAFGQMLLPADQVARIERGSAPLETYRRVKRSLQSSSAMAEEWLQLALWSQANDLSHGIREAALRAADLAPELVGLAPLMAQLGRVLDTELNRWVTEDEFMRSRGFAQLDGRWLSPAEVEAHVAVVREREGKARELLAAQALQAAAESLERAEQQAAVRREEEMFLYALNASRRPVVVLQGGFVVQSGQSGPRRQGTAQGDREAASVTYRRLANRQPGSFIPVSQYNFAPASPSTPSFDDHPSISRSSPGRSSGSSHTVSRGVGSQNQTRAGRERSPKRPARSSRREKGSGG